MAGYDVVIGELRRAGGAAASAGEQAAAVDLAGSIVSVSDALPGSRSAQAVAELALRWREMMADWCVEAKLLGQNMTSSAELYAVNDDAAREAFAPGLLDRLGLG